MKTEVLIVGAGPVGLTLAIELGRRGIACVLAEKKAEPAFLPKMERCNARTMEIYRRIGLAERIRAAGLRAEVPMDVFVILNMTRPPLLHLPYPSVAAAQAQIRAVNDGSQPCEPYQLISQYTLEPLLKAAAEALPSVDVRYGHEFLEFTQDEAGVTAVLATATGSVHVRAKYLVGCDGGASTVRKQLGIRLRGEGNLSELHQALFRCDELFDRIPIGRGPGHGRHYHVADDKNTFLIMQDSTRHWTLHATVESPAEMAPLFEAVVGIPLRYEMLSCAPWRQNLLLADTYGEGRVLLAGDAVHLVIPTGGLGMNTGIGDAVDLAWKLAGTLRGWGGPKLLRSYEVERRQVGERNVGASRYASLGRRRWRSQWRPEIAEDSAAGQAARENLARIADVEQRKTNEMIGAELGYRYVDSPVIDNIPGGPEHLFREYHPTSWPGARLPNVWLADGSALQDHIPDDAYCLLRLGRGADQPVTALQRGFAVFGAPLNVVDIADPVAREVQGYDLLLLRPDLHIVWRGNRLPEEADKLAAVATGH